MPLCGSYADAREPAVDHEITPSMVRDVPATFVDTIMVRCRGRPPPVARQRQLPQGQQIKVPSQARRFQRTKICHLPCAGMNTGRRRTIPLTVFNWLRDVPWRTPAGRVR